MRTTRLGTVVLALALALLGSVIVVPSALADSAGTMVASINASRRAAGLAPYAVRSDLAAVALAQAQRMAAADRLYHNPNLATDVKNYAWAGENVGYGPDLVTLHQAFMNSPEHRANILSTRFTEVGVGVVTKDGVVWVAEVFRRPWSAGSTTTTTTKTATTKAAATPTRTVARSTRPAASPAAKAATKPATKPAAPVVPVAATAAKTPVASPAPPSPDVTCVADAQVATTIEQLGQEERSVRQVEALQRLVAGFQCGSGLAPSGVLDQPTLAALADAAA